MSFGASRMQGWNFNFFESTKYIFTSMVASAAGRASFISNCIAFARQHHFDGVDIDWEYVQLSFVASGSLGFIVRLSIAS